MEVERKEKAGNFIKREREKKMIFWVVGKYL